MPTPIDPYGAWKITRPTEPGPVVVVPPKADIPAAERDLLDVSQRVAERQLGPGAAADVAAREQVARVAQPRTDIPETPSWSESARRAFLPQIIQDDQRPLSQDELDRLRTRAAERGLLEAASGPVGAVARLGQTLGLVEQTPIGRLFPDVPPPRTVLETFRNEDAEGLKSENETLWLMRVLGSAAGAAVLEGAARLPVPSPPHLEVRRKEPEARGAFEQAAQTRSDLARSRSLADVAQALDGYRVEMFGPEVRQLGDVLGAEIGHGTAVQRDTAVGRFAEGVLERIERGEGFESAAAAMARKNLGPEFERYGYAAGMLLDMFADYEGAALSGPRAAAKLRERMAAIRDLAPDIGVVERGLEAMKRPTIDTARWLGAKIVADIEAGGASIDDLPKALLPYAQQTALNAHGKTLEELAFESGVGLPSRAPSTDAAEMARRAELTDAQVRAGAEVKRIDDEQRAREAAAVQAGKVPGQTPGEFVERPAPAPGARTPDTRPVLPNFDRPVGSAVEFFDRMTELYKGADVPPKGWKTPPATGFKRFIDADQQTPNVARYILRNPHGDVVHVGTFTDTAERMLARQMDGDRVSFGDRRPVLSWSKKTNAGTDQPHLALDYLFRSPDEERIVRAVHAKDPRANPVRLRQMADAKEARKAARAAGAVLANATTGAPRTLRVAGADTAVGKAVEDAVRLWALDRTPAAELRQLPGTGAMVDPATWDDIMGRVRERFALEDAQAAKGQAPPDYAARRAQAIRDLGGAVADSRNRIRGSMAFVDRVQQVLSTQHLDRARFGAIGERVRKSTAWFTSRAFEDRLSVLPPQVRDGLVAIRTSLERNADEFREELETTIKSLGGRFGNLEMGKVLERILPAYTPRTVGELRLADAITGAPLDAARIPALAAEVAKRPDAPWVLRSPPSKGWSKERHEAEVAAALTRWARAQVENAADYGKKYLRALSLASGGKAVTGASSLGQAIDDLPADLLRQVHDEVFVGGELLGEATAAALSRVAPDVLKRPDLEGGIVGFLLNLRAESIVNAGLDQLLDIGVAVRASDPRVQAAGGYPSVLHARATGADRFRRPDGRWESRYSEGALAWADQTLLNMGIEPGSGAALTTQRLGNEQVVIPEYLAEDLRRVMRKGGITGSDLTRSEAYNEIMRQFKAATTTGLLVPKPSYFAGQILAVLPTLAITRGMEGAASTVGTLFRHRGMIGELMMRLSGSATPITRSRDPFRQVFRTGWGEWLTAPQLEALAREAGLADTIASYEQGPQIVSLLRNATSGPWNPRRLLMPLEEWQAGIRWLGGVADQGARLSVFLDELAKGTPPARAGEVARNAVLNFRDLTEWEAQTLRHVFTFYAFLRKNTDAHVRQLFRNPGRLGQQLRMAHASVTENGLDEVQLGQLRDDDVSRLVLWDDRDVVDDQGRVNPYYRMNRFSSPPIGIGEGLGGLRFFATLGTAGLAGTEQDRKKIVDALNPFLQDALLLFGATDGAENVRVTPQLHDTLSQLGLDEALGIGPVVLHPERGDDPLLADEEATAANGGVPSVWGVGGALGLTPEERDRKRQLYQAVMKWASGPVANLEALARALQLSPARPTVTGGKEALSWASGTRPIPQATSDEALRQALERQRQRLEAATSEVGKSAEPR